MKLIKKSSKPEISKPQESPKYTDLRQVMDYNRDFSMFYSGVEYEAYLDGCYNMGIRNFLMSYEYLRTKGAKQLKKYSDMHLFIDSGAYTYMSDPKYMDFTEEQWEEQIKSYLNWAEKHKDSIFGMAELDLQNLLGYDTIDRWRKKYFEPFMLRTGIPVCFVYHDEGKDIWEKMCQRYPYVGFSAVSDEDKVFDLSEFKEMLKIAEKYNSLVHGFGMTRTSLLPELPYYTVDSTSWKSGFRYGQLAVWNGKKVQMFKKEDWETKAFKYLDSYKDIFLDKELLYDYYEPEVLRANVYAYKKAEEFIIDRLKPLTYWKRPTSTKKDLNNLPSDFFPPASWFNKDQPHEGLRDYCIKMNVNPELETAYNVIYDITTFLNWDNPEYSTMVEWYNNPEQESLIDELHDIYINRIVPDKETKIADLIKFFGECVSGNNDKLLYLGTNFDRIVKEREEYITEDDEELVDISDTEIRLKLHNLLPDKSSESEGTEISELDEEIFRKANIIPTFDEKGKFVKGQVSVRKPKQVYSKKFPKVSCDTCFAAAKCPEYKSGYVCAYNKMFDRFSTRDMGDIIQSMQGIVDYNMARMQRSMIMETLSGTIDPTTTQLMETNMRYMQMLKQMYENGSAEVLRQTKVLKADGTQETTTSITNPQSGGIMEKLFGKMMNTENDTKDKNDPENKEVIEIKPE